MQEQLPKTDPTRWVSEHGDALYAYAVSRLKNADSAEDVVQETLLGALKNLNRFPPQKEVGPWLMGILKKKVVDRKRELIKRYSTLGDVDPIFDKLFDKSGKWSKASRSGDPLRLDSLEQAEFTVIFKRCLRGLPRNQAEVFAGRELKGQSADELCNELEVSLANLWVLMHRARLRLAECIRARWDMWDT